MRKVMIISISIFSLAFWLWRIPFIIWFPMPEFGPDAFGYFSLVQAFQKKTAFSYPFDVPLAFPFFVYAVGLFSSKVISIIWLQFILKYFSGLLLIYVFCKYYNWLGVAAAVLLSIYFTDSWSLRYDTAFIPDSLYNSFLIAAVAFLILSIKSATNISLLLLSISIFLVAFTRSNGIYIYFLIPLMAVILLRSEQRLFKYISLFAPILILQTGAFCFKTFSNILHPTNSRLMSVLNREAGSLKSMQGSSYLIKKWNMSKEFFRMDDFPSFHFSLLPIRYHNIYELDQIHNPDYYMFNWDTPIPDDLRKFVYREYYNEPEILRKNKHRMEISYAYQHPLFFMIHVLYKFQSIIFRNVFWYILFFGVLLLGCWYYIRSRFTDREALMVILLCAIHLLGLLSVIFGHENPVPRYAHVSEFILYLSPIFALLLKLPSIRVKTQ